MLFLSCYLITGAVHSQKNVDSLFLGVNNNDLYVSPVFGGVITWKQNQSGAAYPVRADSNRRMFRVSTFDSDIKELSKEFSEKSVSVALYRLLSDTTRDIFANALLFELLDNRSLGKLLFWDRSDWIRSGKKDKDIKFWKEFLKSKEYMD